MAFPAFSHDHFLLPSLFLFQRDCSYCDCDANQLARKRYLFTFMLLYLHLAVVYDPVFPCRERVGAISAALRFILLFVSPCWLLCVCTETDLRPTALPRMFCLCSGCLPSSLSLFWCSLDGHQDFLGIGDEGYGTKTFSKLVKERFWMFGVPHAMLHAAFVCQFKVCLV